jgi:hypothetical protein
MPLTYFIALVAHIISSQALIEVKENGSKVCPAIDALAGLGPVI